MSLFTFPKNDQPLATAEKNLETMRKWVKVEPAEGSKEYC